MNHRITAGSLFSSLLPSCVALAQALGQANPGDTFDVEESVFRSRPFAWDLSEQRHAAHRPAFDAIVAGIGSILAAKAAADEAARIAAENAPPQVPFAVTARQLFPVLRRAHGITPEAIEAAISNPAVIADADDRADALIEFRRAYLIERSNPLIALLAGVFNLDDAQIDAAFIAAEKR